LDGRVPGGGIALRLIGFQHQEIGNRFDGDQAGLRAVKVFILAQRHRFGSHPRAELLALLLIVLVEQLLQQSGEPLVRAVGGGDKGSQLCQDEEMAQGAQTGHAELLKDEMGGE
jgi:hypothetical protein